MRLTIISLVVLICVAACGPTQEAPLPTIATLPDQQATPTADREPVANTPQPDESELNVVSVTYSGAISGAFDTALLTAEVGKDYILLLENTTAQDPVQLRVILRANIEPGTYAIVAAQDFQLPEAADVAAQFDLGFAAQTYSGEFTIQTLGEDNFNATLSLSAQNDAENVTVSGDLKNLNAVIFG